MIPSIYYESEAYSLKNKNVMGRQAAGDSFIRGLLKHYSGPEIWFYKSFLENSDLINTENKKLKLLETKNYYALRQSGLLYFPSPDISNLAFLRQRVSDNAWSLCGITHTTSSDRIMDGLTRLITSPTRPWDAVICTSEAVKQHCNNVLSCQIDYLKREIGLNKLSLPKFPVIPLGIDISSFQNAPIDIAAKRKLAIDSDEIVILYLGRLSFHAKAHPFQMYQALQHAASKTNKKLCLIECGWFPNDYVEKAFQEVFAKTCTDPNIRHIKIDGTEQDQKLLALQASDIFISLSDNIQETFGITPLEAMACGLPVLVSDWDGYKETVTSEVGFKIPTYMPRNGMGKDIINYYAAGIDNYDHYLGKVSSLISVDQRKLNDCLVQLISDENLRKNMGSCALKHVSRNYDWSVIIKQYSELWRELSSIRNHELSSTPGIWASRLDPFESFSHYSTHTLALDDQVSLVSSSELTMRQVDERLDLEVFSYNKSFFATNDDLKEILNLIGDNKMKIVNILQNFPEELHAVKFRLIYWLLKANLVELR